MEPKIHPSVFVAEGAQIWGDVEIAAGSSVWFGAVIRGDEGKVMIGENTNIQDNCVIHSDLGKPVAIGDRVTIGHGSVLRSCEISNGVMVGMNSTIMSGVTIGERCVVGAHSLITYNRNFDDDSLIAGSPAKKVRETSQEEKQYSQIACDVYAKLVIEYREGRIRGHGRRE